MHLLRQFVVEGSLKLFGLVFHLLVKEVNLAIQL